MLHYLCRLKPDGLLRCRDRTCCEKKFNLARCSWEDYKGTRFYTGQQVLVVVCWLNRVEENASGLTLDEWDLAQDADVSQPPVATLINSLELQAAGFTMREVISPALKAAARCGMRRYRAGLRQLE